MWSYLKKCVRRKKKIKEYYSSNEPLIQELIDSSYKTSVEMQIMEDESVEENIEAEALILYTRWKYAPTILVNNEERKICLQIIDPFRMMYTVYNNKVAKYIDTDIKTLIWDRYTQLIKQ